MDLNYSTSISARSIVLIVKLLAIAHIYEVNGTWSETICLQSIFVTSSAWSYTTCLQFIFAASGIESYITCL